MSEEMDPENTMCSTDSPSPTVTKSQKQLNYLKSRRVAEEAQKERKEQAVKAINYLLQYSKKFSDVYRKNLSKGMDKSAFSESKACAASNGKKDTSYSLKYLEGGKLYDYQMEGLTWLINLYSNAMNGILADEMGLGKTIQVIAMLCYLYEIKVLGPFLVVCPLSTIPNWKNEFERFAPKIPVSVFYGGKDERPKLKKMAQKKYEIGKWLARPVILTTYEMIRREYLFFSTMNYKYVVIDEGHKLKNHNSSIAQLLSGLASTNRLILTGTPLQNNIKELWSLLKYLMPDIFNNLTDFSSLLMVEDLESEDVLQSENVFNEMEKNHAIGTLHDVLEPFMLRRLKKDVLISMPPKKEVLVYCPLSELQKNLYAHALNHTLVRYLYKEEEEESVQISKRRRSVSHNAENKENNKTTVRSSPRNGSIKEDTKTENFIYSVNSLNTFMGLKHIANHPYIIKTPLDPLSKEKQVLINEELVTNSGKFIVLDAMLSKLKRQGHKILLFTTSVLALDYIEDLMVMRGYKYSRLDGQQNLERRYEEIDQFKVDSQVFVFLISTRAGGLGLNLMAADTVIFFDRDWNPQVDLQAQDRCYRIGQDKPVMIYTLISRNTIDETIIARSKNKMLLEKLVIYDGKFKNRKEYDKLWAAQLLELKTLFEKGNHEEILTSRDLDKILDRSELKNRS